MDELFCPRCNSDEKDIKKIDEERQLLRDEDGELRELDVETYWCKMCGYTWQVYPD